MKKLFTSPVVEVKSLSPENEVMGVFSASAEATTPSESVVVVTDTKSVVDDNFGYWTSK